jgi:hypothetical protein
MILTDSKKSVAQAEYKRVKAAAWAELDRARAPAWSELDRDRALGWIEFWRFHASLDGAAEQLSKWEAEYKRALVD